MTVEVDLKFPMPGSGEWTSVGHGRIAPVRFRAHVRDEPGCPYELDLDIEVRDGRPRCVEFTARPAEGDAVGTAGLRGVALKEYLARALAGAALPFSVDGVDEQGRPMVTIGGAASADMEGTYAVASDAPDRDLAEVARIYCEAHPSGSPTKAVKKAFNIGYATAQRRVREARAAGFDMPAAPRRPNKVED